MSRRFDHFDSRTLGDTKDSSRLVERSLSTPDRNKKRDKWGELERETGLEPATFSLEGLSVYAQQGPS